MELPSMWWKGKCEQQWPTLKTLAMDDNCQQLFESKMTVSKIFYEAKLVAGQAPCGESEIRIDL